jgi:hypothetical protein
MICALKAAETVGFTVTGNVFVSTHPLGVVAVKETLNIFGRVLSELVKVWLIVVAIELVLSLKSQRILLIGAFVPNSAD